MAVLLAVAPSSATAQTKPGASTESTAERRALAETLFFAGRGMMADGRVVEACAKFTESYRLDPALGTLLNLGVCHETIGRIASAWGEFREARVQARKANRPDREQLAADRIAAIEPDLPWVTIVVLPAARVPGLEVKLNDVSLGEPAWGTELPADPGDAKIVATAPGFLPTNVVVSLAKRDHKSVSISPLRMAPRPAVALRPHWSTRKTVGFWMMAGGGVALAGGGVLGYFAASQKSKSDEGCPVSDGELRCTSAGVAANDKARTFAWLADGAFAAGVLSAGVGAFFFFSSPSAKPPSSATAPRLDVGFGGSPGGTMATLRGSF